MEGAMRNTALSSRSRCYTHVSSLIDAAIPKLTILPPNLRISLSIQFPKNRLRMIRGSEPIPTTSMINTNKNKNKKMKKRKKQRSWVKPINRLARRISSMIYNSFGMKKPPPPPPPPHWDGDDEVEEEERGETEKKEESLEYLMYKLSLALDGTTSSRYAPLMELLKQMRDGGGDDGGGERLVRERKVGMGMGIGRGFHVFSRRRRMMRNRARTNGKTKKMQVEEREEEGEEEEWGKGQELCNRRILMGWRCRPIRDDDDHDFGLLIN